MKHWKPALALALNLVLLLGLVLFTESAFGAVTQEDLLGQWTTSIPAAERVEAALLQMGLDCDIDDSLQMTFVFEYQKGNVLTVQLEEASARNILKAQTDALRAALPALFYAQYQSDYGMTKEQADAQLAAQGLTIDSLVEMTLESMDFEDLLSAEAMTVVEYYCMADGKLCYASTLDALEAGNYELFVEPTIDGDTLTLGNAVDAEGNPFIGSGGIEYPITLKRK